MTAGRRGAAPDGFGRRLRRLREAAGLSQTALAGDDLHPSYISMLESGRRAPTPAALAVIARRLGVSRQHILRLTNELAADGLTRQVANPDHKTSPLIELTAAGRETLAAINARADESNRALQSELTDADLARLRRLLQRFTAIVASTRVR